MKKVYANAIIRNSEGKILILRRSWSAPWMDYKWSLPGGHLEEGEEPIDALIRELKEETTLAVNSADCVEVLKMTEDDGTDKHVSHYFSVNIEGRVEDKNIMLDFENDKYNFVTEDEAIKEDLIPNLDLVFEQLKPKPEVEVDEIKTDIIKGFDDILGYNPFYEVEKGLMNTAKLTLKTITDKLGHRTKRWVKTEQPQKAEPKQPKVEEPKNEKQPAKPEPQVGIDYHSIYKDDEKLKGFASKTKSEHLAAFIEREKNNPNAKRLVDISQAELKQRGEEVKNPYGDEKEPEPKQETKQPEPKKEPKPKEDNGGWNDVKHGKLVKPTKEDVEAEANKLSKPAQEHLDLTDLADTKEDLLNYLPEIDKDKNISDEERDKVKSKVYEQIGKLIATGKGEEKPKSEPKQPEAKKEEPKPEPKKPEKPDYSAMSDKEKLKTIKGATKNPDGVYNPETGEGYTGDNSLGEKAKANAETVDDNIKSDIQSLLSPSARRGKLVMQTGSGGLGKTYTAVNELKKNGYKEIEIGDKSRKGDKSANGFVHIKGSMTPTSLYEAMHDYPNAVFLIDDARRIFQSPEALEYIKAATDTSTQTVTRGTAGGGADKAENDRATWTEQLDNLKQDDKDFDKQLKELQEERNPSNKKKIDSIKKKQRDLKTKISEKQRNIDALGDIRHKQFEFKGKIMMISNRFPTDDKRLREEMYEPLMSRTSSGKITDLKMTDDAKLYKLSTLVPHFQGGVDNEGKAIKPKDFKERHEIYDFVKKLVKEGRTDDISTRLLSGVMDEKRLHESNGKNWKMELLKKYPRKDEGDMEKGFTFTDVCSHLENLILGNK